MIFNYDILSAYREYDTYKNGYSDANVSNAIICDFFMNNVISDKDKVINFENNLNNNTIWDDDVSVILAKFNCSLDYMGYETAGDITHLYIQKRVVGDLEPSEWVTYYKLAINDSLNKNLAVSHNDNGHIQFDFVDKFISDAGSTNINNAKVYEYRLVPVVYDYNTGDENYGIASEPTDEVYTFSKDNYIYDSDIKYKLVYDFKFSEYTNKRPTSFVETLGSKYPIAMTSGKVNYDTGSISCTVIGDNTFSNNIDIQEQLSIREDLKNWLSNGKAKILKLTDGTYKLIHINSDVSVDINENILGLFGVSFSFTEIGDANNPDDLSKFGLIINDL